MVVPATRDFKVLLVSLGRAPTVAQAMARAIPLVIGTALVVYVMRALRGTHATYWTVRSTINALVTASATTGRVCASATAISPEMTAVSCVAPTPVKASLWVMLAEAVATMARAAAWKSFKALPAKRQVVTNSRVAVVMGRALMEAALVTVGGQAWLAMRT